ncbi:MAG: acetate kinase [Actinobacteria bacterium]|nr:acetate kinase [Actinomycetota bacterium]
MKILTINSGSTSIKFKLLEMPLEKLVAEGRVENIGLASSAISFSTESYDEKNTVCSASDHHEGFRLIINRLTDPHSGVIKDAGEIKAVGHRVVNVGDRVLSYSVINGEILGFIRECIELAPLHNPPNLAGIEVCMEIFPQTPNIAIFDNLFHKDMPEKAYIYGLPYEYYEKYRLRKYGFHGIAYTYMIKRLSELLKKDPGLLRIIAVMLGGGSSITAVRFGRSVDTSMGFTPAEGLIMSTRCGDIDPASIPYLMKKENLNISEIDDVINKKSGILGISGKYSNFRQLEAGYLEGDRDCVRAFDSYIYRIRKYIGAYCAAMNGLDTIVFGGGIGENSFVARRSMLADMDFFGIKIDEEKNRNLRGEGVISAADSRVSLLVVNLNEELVIARETYSLAADFYQRNPLDL